MPDYMDPGMIAGHQDLASVTGTYAEPTTWGIDRFPQQPSPYAGHGTTQATAMGDEPLEANGLHPGFKLRFGLNEDDDHADDDKGPGGEAGAETSQIGGFGAADTLPASGGSFGGGMFSNPTSTPAIRWSGGLTSPAGAGLSGKNLPPQAHQAERPGIRSEPGRLRLVLLIEMRDGREEHFCLVGQAPPESAPEFPPLCRVLAVHLGPVEFVLGERFPLVNRHCSSRFPALTLAVAMHSVKPENTL